MAVVRREFDINFALAISIRRGYRCLWEAEEPFLKFYYSLIKCYDEGIICSVFSRFVWVCFRQ